MRTPRHAPLLLLLVLAALPARAGQAVDETLPANRDAQVRIDNLAGSVKVHGWSDAQVRVTGTLGADVERLDLERDPRDVRIKVVIPRDDKGRHRNLDSALEIWVPAGSRLEVDTVSASITAGELDGQVDLASVSGNVTLDGRPTRADLETVSGSIDFHGDSSVVDAESVSGDVTLDGVSRRLEVATVSGNATVTASEIDHGKIGAVSGDVRFSGSLASQGALEIGSHSGGIVLALPAATSAIFEIETFSGEINNDFGSQAASTSRYSRGRSLEFTAGGGDGRIKVSTFSGSVTLRHD